MKDLFNDSLPSQVDAFQINSQFATKYEQKKRVQELNHLQEKYQNNELDEVSDDDTDTDTDEDEVGVDVTPAVDAQIFRTIAAIRAKDDRVYDPKCTFFDAEQLQALKEKAQQTLNEQVQEKHVAPVYLKDFHRQTLLEGGIPGIAAESTFTSSYKNDSLPHVQEQEALKNAFKQAADIDNEEQSDDDDLLVPRKMNNEEQKEEEDEYKKWLLTNLTDEPQTRSAFKDWVDYQQDEKADIDTGEKFLMNFIFNRGWIDRSENAAPTMDEILNEDEEHEDKAVTFETKYNFRFEELDALNGRGASFDVHTPPTDIYNIPTHARVDPLSIRRKDNKRTDERERRKIRKAEEKTLQEEELKRLKNLKKKEIWENLKKVQSISGVVDDDQLVDLLESNEMVDEDFDPEKWDKKMKEVFNEDYYNENENIKPFFDEEDRKPFVSGGGGNSKSLVVDESVDLDEYEYGKDDIDQDIDQIKPAKRSRRKVQDEDEDDFIMDADYVPDFEEPAAEPLSDDKQKKISDFLEEYYQLDFEDMIGDLPTRFKYRTVEADSFGLGAKEIIEADDTQLNEYLSLKKLAPYRTSENDQKWLSVWKKNSKKRRTDFRKKLQETAQVEEKRALKLESEESTVKKQKKTDLQLPALKKKKSKKLKSVEVGVDIVLEPTDDGKMVPVKQADGSSKKRKKRSSTTVAMESDRLAAYGIGVMADGKSKKHRSH